MSEKVTNAVNSMQEVYDFFTGGDSKMAAPLAKVFLCLCILLGVALYLVSDTYFTLLSKANADVVRYTLVVKAQDELKTRYKDLVANNDDLENELTLCKVMSANEPKKVTNSYNALTPAVKDRGKTSNRRIYDILNN